MAQDEGLDELADLVRRYKASARTTITLDEVVEKASPYVKSLCARVINVVPSVLDRDDLLQHGYMGLLQAIDRWEPERNPNFKAYAFSRVFYSMKDAVRHASSTSRGRNVRFESLDLPAWPAPSSQWVEDEFMAFPEIVIGDRLAQDDPALESVDWTPRLNLPKLVHDVVEGLSQKQALIVLLLMNGMSSKQVGYLLEISPPQVSQEKKTALLRLRAYLTEHIGPNWESVI